MSSIYSIGEITVYRYTIIFKKNL